MKDRILSFLLILSFTVDSKANLKFSYLVDYRTVEFDSAPALWLRFGKLYVIVLFLLLLHL